MPRSSGKTATARKTTTAKATVKASSGDVAAPVADPAPLPLKEYRTVTAEERLANDTATPPVEALTDTSVAELAAANEAAQQKAIDKAAG